MLKVEEEIRLQQHVIEVTEPYRQRFEGVTVFY